jgi:hypothetical protein
MVMVGDEIGGFMRRSIQSNGKWEGGFINEKIKRCKRCTVPN